MQGRCAGCSYEGSTRRVLEHQRSCDGFALLYRTDPAAALADPALVYAAANPVVIDEPSHPIAAKPAAVPQRRSRAAKRVSAGVPRVPGSVVVEYWDWQPTMLEELQDLT